MKKPLFFTKKETLVVKCNCLKNNFSKESRPNWQRNFSYPTIYEKQKIIKNLHDYLFSRPESLFLALKDASYEKKMQFLKFVIYSYSIKYIYAAHIDKKIFTADDRWLILKYSMDHKQVYEIEVDAAKLYQIFSYVNGIKTNNLVIEKQFSIKNFTHAFRDIIYKCAIFYSDVPSFYFAIKKNGINWPSEYKHLCHPIFEEIPAFCEEYPFLVDLLKKDRFLRKNKNRKNKNQNN